MQTQQDETWDVPGGPYYADVTSLVSIAADRKYKRFRRSSVTLLCLRVLGLELHHDELLKTNEFTLLEAMSAIEVYAYSFFFAFALLNGHTDNGCPFGQRSREISRAGFSYPLQPLRRTSSGGTLLVNRQNVCCRGLCLALLFSPMTPNCSHR